MSNVTIYQVTEDDRSLIDEFRRQPVGHHSRDLQRLLNRFRGEPIEGKYVLLCTKPHKEWVLRQLTGPGKPINIFNGTRFKSLAEGEWEIFRRRWRRYAGTKID